MIMLIMTTYVTYAELYTSMHASAPSCRLVWRGRGMTAIQASKLLAGVAGVAPPQTSVRRAGLVTVHAARTATPRAPPRPPARAWHASMLQAPPPKEMKHQLRPLEIVFGAVVQSGASRRT